MICISISRAIIIRRVVILNIRIRIVLILVVDIVLILA